ncbi:MAG: hydrolase [Clostridia bacterium]|nr:hydrolase [Clostridia bacterium]MBR2944131.1 hydrolase [Clostridia bacterium]
MNARDKFIEIFKSKIKREGADKLLEFICSPASDFFTAPASARYHSAYEGGLCEHSINVYECLCDYLNRSVAKEKYGLNYSDETIAIVSLLHDLCKMNIYKVSYRNAKNEQGVWEKVPYYEFDDTMPYGHGEKSVYMITPFIKLTREEAFAIRYHMGFSNVENQMATNNVSKAFEMYPLAFALSTADMEATYYIESKKNKK